MAVHTVASGDTLWNIARANDVDLQTLIGLNPDIKNPDRIFVGQQINIPDHRDDSVAPTVPTISATPGSGIGPDAPDATGVSVYRVKSGDTLSRIAARMDVPLSELLAANRQIHNPNLIVVGQLVNIPGGDAEPSPWETEIEAPHIGPGRYDGRAPAEGTVARPWAQIDPPFRNQPGQRSAWAYSQAIDQFAVGSNSRYGTGATGAHVNDDDADLETHVTGANTYCNIFAWDVTKAMGVEIPHFYDPDNGEKVAPGSPGYLEMNVRRMVGWMHDFGQHNGWQKVSAAEAQAMANDGHPVLALWDNPTGGHGHVAVVRPGEGEWVSGQFSPAIAQAGRMNDGHTHVLDQFGSRKPIEYWVCPSPEADAVPAVA